MTDMEIYKKVYDVLRREENYVPRDYQTIGGMWTVDTWRKGDVTLRIMDEGYTIIISSSQFDIHDVDATMTVYGDREAIAKFLQEYE